MREYSRGRMGGAGSLSGAKRLPAGPGGGILAAALMVLGAPGVSPFAGEIDTVRVGSPSLDLSKIPIGTEIMESWRLEDGERVAHTTTRQTIRRETRDGEEVFVVRTVHASGPEDTTIGTIVARARDLALLHHKVKGPEDSAAVSVTSGHLTGWVVLPGQPSRFLDQALERPVFPIEGQMPWILKLLPYEEGYAAVIPHFNEWRGGEVWRTIRVLGSETIEHEGRSVDCWRVDRGELWPGHRAILWVEKPTHCVLRTEIHVEGEEPPYGSVIRVLDAPDRSEATIESPGKQEADQGGAVSQEEQDRRIDYIEMPADDIEAGKAFYRDVFGWTFTDYGPDYTSFSDGRLAGGLRKESEVPAAGILVVLYALDLEAVEAEVREHGGRITRETFEFPGGRRFHFKDPAGNELAVWSDR
jgi:predicted enzyme related to lactoylglutathione lyase